MVQQPMAPSSADSFQSGFDGGYSAGHGVVERARRFIGDTARDVGVRSTLWCSAFLRKLTGAQDVDDRALSWERHRRVAPQVGAVVTMGRRGGGHVGVVSGFTRNGDPIVISGNHSHRVAESVYPRSRIRAWVSPT
ncbi:CHAP domain-containing protein [Bradyrhizobium sp. SZCCHNS3053]|uniref:CHAP domain-containing protein n=1 Tax=Bradyrhizobium sp. SZCCHNS3053 TaxID=3057322 RepID=UPI0029165F12|nr:CHAP domain-containing protein [Bradyrhizobium sp. SZCCHNS3053]